MKILKKVNKGLILTLIVLIALTIYLVRLEKQRADEKDNIQEKCEEFIKFTDEFLVLPVEMQTLTENTSEAQLEKYAKQMEPKLRDIMINNEDAIKIQSENLKEQLKNGYITTEIRTGYNRKITKISSYEFDGNEVTVKFNSKVVIESKYLNVNQEEKVNQNEFNSTGDEITLQKINDEWKVVYASMQYSSYNLNNYVDTGIMY